MGARSETRRGVELGTGFMPGGSCFTIVSGARQENGV